jgi:ATP synthase protein I
MGLYKKNSAWAENVAIVTQLGLTMAGSIAFCFFIGLKLDQWLGTRGVFTAVFILLGIIGGGVVSYRQIMKVFDEEDRDKKGPQNGND